MTTRRARAADKHYDKELTELPAELRWREWMVRVEAVIFASPVPVDRATLSKVVGRDYNLDLLVEDLRDEVEGRAFESPLPAAGSTGRGPVLPTRCALRVLSKTKTMRFPNLKASCLVVLPITLVYTLVVYFLFKGKVEPGADYSSWSSVDPSDETEETIVKASQ